MFSDKVTPTRGTVRILGTRGTCATLTSPRADRLLTQHIKALPQKARRWDKYACLWRIRITHVDTLIDSLVRGGFDVQDER